MAARMNPGRFAGLLYVLFSIPGFFALIYVPSKIIVHANFTATASNITAHETLSAGHFRTPYQNGHSGARTSEYGVEAIGVCPGRLVDILFIQ